MDSVQKHKGLTLSVEIARQGGKNELSAHLEVLLLTLYMAQGGKLIKCSPTFKPQTVISMQRLKERLDDFGFDGIYHTEMGYIIVLGSARQIFLSAEPAASVVGHTADILLEIDESQDSTVITIAACSEQRVACNDYPLGATHCPLVRVVEQYQWRGIPHPQLYPQMVGILKRWNCRRIVVDATGIGQPVASFLRTQLGSKVKPFTFTQKSKSDMGFEMLSFINSGRLKLYKQDGSQEYRETMFELEKAKAQYCPNQTMNFYVDSSEGHADFLMSLALLVIGARDFSPRQAKGLLTTS